MVALQILNRVILSGDSSVIASNNLTRDYFEGYGDEYDFIVNHVSKYGNVPDKETFLSKFQDFDLVEVNESDKYLVDAIREEYLYRQSVPIIQNAAKLLKSDSLQAAEYLIQALREIPITRNEGVDIIATADERLQKYLERKEHSDDYYFTCGFKELDDLIYGINREVELFVIFARTNQGKSWVLEKMCAHIWQIGFNVGYISPEMTSDSVGYRFDTLIKKFSNKSLMYGMELKNQKKYEKYIKRLKSKKKPKPKFIVASPNDFSYAITVTKLRSFIMANELSVLAIDGITYLTDERYRRGDNKNTSLTNIAEDLRLLSLELKVPILVVVQANRGGVIDDKKGAPELESIRDSDGISHNATKVLSLRQIDGKLTMEVKKNTYGAVGGKVSYIWNIDRGDFKFTLDNDEEDSVEYGTHKEAKTPEGLF